MSRIFCGSYGIQAVLAVALGLVTACASVSDLPGSASEVNYQRQLEPRELSSENFEACAIYADVDSRMVFSAAEYGLTVNDFEIQDSHLASGTLRGKHGVSGVNWNIVAGVYFREQPQGIAVKIIALTSRNFSLFKDDTGQNWAKSILGDLSHNLETILAKPVTMRSCQS